MVLCHLSQINRILFHFNDTGQHKKPFSLPVKIQGDSYSFDISESEYDNQIALSPTNVKEEGIKLKNYICNKKVIHWFLTTTYIIK
jgi:hypothetical protein